MVRVNGNTTHINDKNVERGDACLHRKYGHW